MPKQQQEFHHQLVVAGKYVKVKTSLPFSKKEDDAGYDLRSAAKEKTVILPGERTLISTDVRLEMSKDTFAKIESRSGLAVKGIDARGGVIDASYRGEVKVILHNTSQVPFEIQPGDRIAQLLFLPILDPIIISTTDELTATERGEKGFGSSGLQ